MNALLLAIALSASTASTPVQAPKAVVTVKAPAAKWVCGAPRALETDSRQTVRLCSTK